MTGLPRMPVESLWPHQRDQAYAAAYTAARRARARRAARFHLPRLLRPARPVAAPVFGGHP